MSDAQRVELSFPARPDMAFLARMTAAAVASRADFGLDQVEDLRLAIDELYVALVGEQGAEGDVRLSFEWTPEAVRVTGSLAGASAGASPVSLSDLSERILDALVDEHGVDGRTGAPGVWLSVRRRA
ncbi:MAG TPA: hypothetical protein VLZ77_02075 [Acidimicrobiales bacterium]|nr:hypothetical protein [Acidimicrobiales bacterium]